MSLTFSPSTKPHSIHHPPVVFHSQHTHVPRLPLVQGSDERKEKEVRASVILWAGQGGIVVVEPGRGRALARRRLVTVATQDERHGVARGQLVAQG